MHSKKINKKGLILVIIISSILLISLLFVNFVTRKIHVKDFKEERNIELYKENNKLKQTLIEIKPTLEFYANSNMGKEQPDRTYKIICNGCYITVYDPKPARQAPQKISEVENVNS